MREPESGLESAAKAAARAYKATRRGFNTARRGVVALESRTLGTKRRRFITGAVVVAFVVAVAGTTVAVGVVDEQNRAAAAKKAADAKALVDAKAMSITVSDEAMAKSAAAAEWADPAVLAEVEAARLVMVESAKGSDTGAIDKAASAVNAALDKIGTVEESQDRAYTAARAAAGWVDSDAEWAAGQGRAYCKQLDDYYATNILGATSHFVGSWSHSSEDMQAIAVFCPQ